MYLFTNIFKLCVLNTIICTLPCRPVKNIHTHVKNILTKYVKKLFIYLLRALGISPKDT